MVPDEFLQVYEQAKPFFEPGDPNVQIGSLLDKIASLTARLQPVLPADRLSGTIQEAMELDEEAQSLIDMLPDSWRYEVMPLHMTPSNAYQGLAHQYPAYKMARHWNALRILRLFLNEIVWHVATFAATGKEQGLPDMSQVCTNLDTQALQATVTANGSQLITEILASAPQFLDENGTTFTTAARFLIWPLSIVAEVASTPEPTRRWAIECLYEIARQARIPQALQAARAVESKADINWIMLYQLG